MVNYYNMLFTKVVPFYSFKDYTIKDIAISFFGNLIGATFYSFLISQTRLAEKIGHKINDLMAIKTGDSLVSVFIMGIFCAVLVAYATFGQKIYPDNKIVITSYSIHYTKLYD